MNRRTRLVVGALVVASEVLAAGSTARAEGRVVAPVTATADVRDCAFGPHGELAAATAGGLWIEARGLVTALDGLPDTRATRVAWSGETIVVETARGSRRVDPVSLTVDELPADEVPPKLRARPTESFAMHEGRLVRSRAKGPGRECLATNGGLVVVRPDATDEVLFSGSLPTSDVTAIALDGHATFVGTFDRGVFVERAGALSRIDSPALDANVNALAFDAPRRTLWVATARGLARCAVPERAPATCRRVGDSVPLHAVVVDARGDVVTGGDGVLAFVDARGEVVAKTDKKGGAPFRAVWSIAAGPDGEWFVGTTSGVYRGTRDAFVGRPDTLVRASMVTRHLPDDWVTALAFTGGTLVVGTYNGGLVRLAPTAGTAATGAPSFEVRASDASLGYVNPHGITVLADGSLAVATMDGLRVGTFGRFVTPPTLGRDVTAVRQLPGETTLRVATRRGVSNVAPGDVQRGMDSWQSLGQRSPSTVLPSSHCSPNSACTTPSPQRGPRTQPGAHLP